MDALALKILILIDRFPRKVIGRILYHKDFTCAEFIMKPGKLRGSWPWWRRLDPFRGCRRQNDERAVLLEFSKAAAIKREKLPKHHLRYLNFGLDSLSRKVRKSRRKVSKYSCERNKLLG